MPARMRVIGLLPAVFFVWTLAVHVQQNTLDHVLWMCNISNLAIAVGFFLGDRRLVVVGTLWVAIGVPLWIWDIAVTGDFSVRSCFTHFGTVLLGIYALRGGDRALGRPWLWAAGFGLAMQLVARLVTAPVYNINVSHRPYDGLEGWFQSYPSYFLFNLVAVGLCLYMAERAITWIAAR